MADRSSQFGNPVRPFELKNGWTGTMRPLTGIERMEFDSGIYDIQMVDGKAKVTPQFKSQPEHYMTYMAATIITLVIEGKTLKNLTPGEIRMLPDEPFTELKKLFDELRDDESKAGAEDPGN